MAFLTSLMALVFAVRAVPQAATPDVKITYRTTALNAKAVLKDLSKVAGIPLTTTPTTADEVLVIRFKNEPLADAMKRIAWAVEGEWKSQGEGFVLARSSEIVHNEERRELALNIKMMKEGLDERRKSLADAQTFNADEAGKLATQVNALVKRFNPQEQNSTFWREKDKLQSAGPLGRALSRLAILFDPEELANMPTQSKVVYALDPTNAQRRLSPAAGDIVQAYLDEQSVWAEAAARQQIHNPEFNGTTYSLGDLTGGLEPLTRDKFGKMLLSVYRWNGMLPSCQFELQIADKQGKVVGRASTNIMPTYAKLESFLTAKPPADAKQLDVPAETAAMLKIYRLQRDESPIVESLRRKLLQPEALDPLGFATGNLLMICADEKDAQMVVDLPDTMLESYFVDGKKFVPDWFLSRVSYPYLEKSPEATGIGFRPLYPASEREHRVDRSALGTFLRRYAQGTPPSIDEQASMALSLPRQSENGLPNTLRMGVMRDQLSTPDENVLRFYGHLDDEAKLAAIKGNLKLSQLPPGCKEDLGRILSAQYVNLNYVQPTGNQDPEAWNRFYNGIYREPTEFMPDGLTASSYLHITVTNDTVARVPQRYVGQASYGAQTMTPQDMAWQIFASSRTDLFPWMATQGQSVPMNKLQYGSRAQLQFTFQFTPQIMMSQALESLDMGDGRYYTLDELPEAFRKQLNEQIELTKKSYANVQPGQFSPNIHASPPP